MPIAEAVKDFDARILIWLNGLSDSWLDYFLAWPSFLGSSYFLLPIMLAFMAIWETRERLVKRFAFIALVTLASGLICHILKVMIERDRPYQYFYDLVSQGAVHINYIFEMRTSSSFPSGHAATVFAVVTALNYVYRNKLTYLYPLAFLVALSRVYVAAHFPTDILMGALIGVACVFLAARGLKLVPNVSAWWNL